MKFYNKTKRGKVAKLQKHEPIHAFVPRFNALVEEVNCLAAVVKRLLRKTT